MERSENCCQHCVYCIVAIRGEIKYLTSSMYLDSGIGALVGLGISQLADYQVLLATTTPYTLTLVVSVTEGNNITTYKNNARHTI